MIKRILVPIDFSETSLEALEHAVALTKVHSADLLLLHVVNPADYAVPAANPLTKQKVFARVEFDGATRKAVDSLLEEKASASAELDRIAQKLAARRVACRTTLRVGNPYVEIVKAAVDDRADMIVMGTHGRTGFSHLMIGSVAEKVVRTSGRPVLTVRSADRKEKPKRQRAQLRGLTRRGVSTRRVKRKSVGHRAR